MLSVGRSDIFSAEDWDRLIAGNNAHGPVRHPMQAIRIDPKEVESIGLNDSIFIH